MALRSPKRFYENKHPKEVMINIQQLNTHKRIAYQGLENLKSQQNDLLHKEIEPIHENHYISTKDLDMYITMEQKLKEAKMANILRKFDYTSRSYSPQRKAACQEYLSFNQSSPKRTGKIDNQQQINTNQNDIQVQNSDIINSKVQVIEQLDGEINSKTELNQYTNEDCNKPKGDEVTGFKYPLGDKDIINRLKCLNEKKCKILTMRHFTNAKYERDGEVIVPDPIKKKKFFELYHHPKKQNPDNINKKIHFQIEEEVENGLKKETNNNCDQKGKLPTFKNLKIASDSVSPQHSIIQSKIIQTQSAAQLFRDHNIILDPHVLQKLLFPKKYDQKMKKFKQLYEKNQLIYNQPLTKHELMQQQYWNKPMYNQPFQQEYYNDEQTLSVENIIKNKGKMTPLLNKINEQKFPVTIYPYKKSNNPRSISPNLRCYNYKFD